MDELEFHGYIFIEFSLKAWVQIVLLNEFKDKANIFVIIWWSVLPGNLLHVSTLNVKKG